VLFAVSVGLFRPGVLVKATGSRAELGAAKAGNTSLLGAGYSADAVTGASVVAVVAVVVVGVEAVFVVVCGRSTA
jgi:hypothetical protein